MKLHCVLLVSACAALINGASAVDSFEEYKKLHGKVYAHPTTYAARKAMFAKTHKMIREHNSRNYTFKMAHNKFSDMTQGERAAHLGAVAPARNGRFQINVFKASADRDVPASLDLRTGNCVGPVKDQGQCGSCWAFAASASLEYASCAKSGSYVALSDQELVSCSQATGCDGGWYSDAWDYVKTNGGQDTQDSYPYASETYSGDTAGTCAFNPDTIGARVESYGEVDKNVEAIQQALNTYGTLSIAIFVADDFYSYSSGVYSSDVCSGLGVNHAVNLVGYGTSDDGIAYWIVRNSWSTSWGSAGYILVKSGVNMCDIESNAFYVVAA